MEKWCDCPCKISFNICRGRKVAASFMGDLITHPFDLGNVVLMKRMGI